MRKNKKTLEFLEKDLTGIFRMKKSRYNQSDNKIGFVIDPDAKQEEQLVYILTTQKERPTYWDIWPLGYENDISKKRSARKYAEALFILLSYAIAKENTQNKRTPSRLPAISLYRTDNPYGPWIRHVFDVITTTKKYREVPATVRHGLKPLLTSIGRRGEKGRIEIAGDCTQRVFFWSIETLNSTDLKKCIADKKPIKLSPVPRNSFELPEILAFSERIRNSSSVKTWMDLYRKYAIEPSYTSSEKWLNISSLEFENPPKSPEQPSVFQAATSQLKTKGLPIDFPNIMNRHKNVLLTGPAGSGKTTALKLLTSSWMTIDKPPEEKYLCFYIRLKDIQDSFEDVVKRKRKIDISQLVGLSVSCVMQDKCSKEELGNIIPPLARGANHRQLGKFFTYEEMLQSIHNEAAEWFEKQGCHQSNVILLIDGLNELNTSIRNMLMTSVEELFNRECRFAITCRSNFANTLFSDNSRQITRFELQELDNQQIVQHLEYNIPNLGKRFFESQIKVDPRILSMAKNPFYLSLFVERIKKDPFSKIPATKVQLIEDFIENSIQRKREETIYEPNNTIDDMIDIVLPKVAKWSIDLLTYEQDSALVSFRDSKEFHDIQNPDIVFKTLGLAEEYGLLSFSGLREESRKSRGYPAFSHDNFRDYFAAQYLKGLGEGVLQQLPGILEYFAWDEPLLFFLELCESNVICEKIRDCSGNTEYF